MGARKLRQRDRQVPDSAVGVSKMSNNSKEAALAAFCCPAVEAYVDLTNSRREHLNNLRLHIAVQPHHEASYTVVTYPQRVSCLWVGKLYHLPKRRRFELAERVVIVDKPRNSSILKVLYFKVSKLVSDALRYINTALSYYLKRRLAL